MTRSKMPSTNSASVEGRINLDDPANAWIKSQLGPSDNDQARKLLAELLQPAGTAKDMQAWYPGWCERVRSLLGSEGRC